MAAYSVFGVSEFSARLTSALCGIGTVLLTYAIGRRLFCPSVGLWGGVILATSPMFVVASRAATPDSVLTFCTTLALYAFVCGAFTRGPGAESSRWPSEGARDARRPFFPSWPLAVFMYGAMGLAVLAKGPVGLVMPTAVIGMFLLIVRLPERSGATALGTLWRAFGPAHFLRTCWAMRPISAVLIVLAVAGPWYYLVHRHTDGAWTQGFFVDHNLERATQAMEGHGGKGVLMRTLLVVAFYPLTICAAFFPWSALLPATALETRARLGLGDSWRSGLAFLVAWVAVFVGVFSLAQTKLPSYVTPAYPALALLTGALLHHWVAGSLRVDPRWVRRGVVAMSLVGLVAIPSAIVAARLVLPGEEWLAVLPAVLPLTGWTALQFARRERRGAAAVSLAVGSVALIASLVLIGVPAVDRHQHSDVLLAAARERSDPPRLASFGLLEPSWVFYARRPITELSGSDVSGLCEFLASGRAACVITTRLRYERIADELPAGTVILAEVPFFMRTRSRDPQLVLLGRRD